MNVAFGSSKFRRIFDFDKNDKIEIMPHIVFHSDMFFKSHIFVVKRFTFKSANKARIFQRLFLLLLFRTEIREGVNDDTENEVQNDDDDNEEEEDVVENPDHEEGIFARGLAQNVTYPSSVPQTLKSSSKN